MHIYGYNKTWDFFELMAKKKREQNERKNSTLNMIFNGKDLLLCQC